jgi:hypothetical protein
LRELNDGRKDIRHIEAVENMSVIAPELASAQGGFSFAPPGLARFPLSTHSLLCGLQFFVASRLRRLKRARPFLAGTRL